MTTKEQYKRILLRFLKEEKIYIKFLKAFSKTYVRMPSRLRLIKPESIEQTKTIDGCIDLILSKDWNCPSGFINFCIDWSETDEGSEFWCGQHFSFEAFYKRILRRYDKKKI